MGWIAYAVLAYGLVTWILPAPLTLLRELGQSIVVWVPALAVAWQLFVTAVTMRYPRWFEPYAGWASDGYRILRVLRSS